MPTIFIGLLALALVLWLAKSFTRVDPKYMIRVGRTAGGIVALAGAAFLGASLGSACWAGRRRGGEAERLGNFRTEPARFPFPKPERPWTAPQRGPRRVYYGGRMNQIIRELKRQAAGKKLAPERPSRSAAPAHARDEI